MSEEPVPPPVEGATCSTCRWAVPIAGAADFVCRGAPPTAILTQAQVFNGWPQVVQKIVGQHPIVGAPHWCAAHRPKQSALRAVGGAV